MRNLLALAVFGLASVAMTLAFAQDAADKDYSAELPRIPPTEPADALKTFLVQPGFKMDLVAAEPLVADPIAVCWDENGRLFVVEMRGYSEQRDEKLSRIRLLQDLDGDGKYEQSRVFAGRQTHKLRRALPGAPGQAPTRVLPGAPGQAPTRVLPGAPGQAPTRDGDSFRIVQKKVELINCDSAFEAIAVPI